MLEILMIESGVSASISYALKDAELSLACISHQGKEMHHLVASWLKRLGHTEKHMACGPVITRR